jgi:hypothetical protein
MCFRYTVLPRSIAPRFIANLTYRQNSRLSRFPPLKIPRYTAKLSYRHPPQVFRHKSRKTNLNSPVSTAHNYLLTAVYWSDRSGKTLLLAGPNVWQELFFICNSDIVQVIILIKTTRLFRPSTMRSPIYGMETNI